MKLRPVISLLLSALLLGAWYVLLVRPQVEVLAFTVAGRELELLAPRWLGLTALVPLLLLLATGSLVDLSVSQRALSLASRALLLVGLALALARPSMVTEERRVCAVYLVDVSASVSDDQLASARATVQAGWAARGAGEVRLITFARRPRAVPLDPDKGAPKILTRHPDQQGGEAQSQASDLQAAVQHAYGQFLPGMLRRMVLLSDGNETHGDLESESHEAAARGVKIHVVKLPDRSQPEVLVRALIAPPEVRVGAPFDLSVVVHSTLAQPAILTLHKDGYVNTPEGRKEVKLQPGPNPLRFKCLVRDAGAVTYQLRVSGLTADTWKHNNSATAVIPVQGRPRVLYVEGEPEHATPLRRALEAERIAVEVRGPHGVPRTAAALAKYDLLLLSDVPAYHVGPGQMAAISSYVRDLGGGFIMAGGPNSFGAGGYYGTRLERLLPVRFDSEKRQDQPTLALMLAMDRSGSMTGLKLELAKEAARATTEILGSADLIGVVAFDSAARVLVRLQRAANRLRILGDIARLTSGGGTSIKPALAEAYSQLAPAAARVKHVILLSDGQSSYAGIPQLVDEMAQARITVSAVGVGSGADRTLLQMIAERGGGRFYHTDDPRSIPKIFTKETTQVARSAVVEESFQVRVVKQANMLGGIDWGAAPPLRGYVSTRPKPGGEVLLASNHGEPLLAIWRVGLGKAAAFTSDAKSRWAAHWLRWRGYGQFWAQLVREVMRHRMRRSFEMKARVDRGTVRVSVDALDRADRFINGLDSTLTVLDPSKSGRSRVTVPMEQDAAGRYTASFRLPAHGPLMLRASHRADGKVVAQSEAAISVPYPEEYAHLIQDSRRLARAAGVAGGRVDPTPRQVFSAGGESVKHHLDLWPRVLLVLLGLFVLDVLLRRVRLFGHRKPSSS